MVEGLHSLQIMDEARAQTLTIGEVSEKTGLPVKRIHYYERRGLVEPTSRSESGYRLYTKEEIARLGFVRRAKLLGLTLEEIRELVELAAECNRGEIIPRLEEVLEEKLLETERKMAELAAFRENLLYYRGQLSGIDPARSCGEEASFCGCLEATTGRELTTSETNKEVNMKKLGIVEENGRSVSISEKGCEDCGCECCDTQGCECC